jgi:hypothetical protein
MSQPKTENFKDHLNPFGFKPEDMKAMGKYLIVDRSLVTEINVSKDGGENQGSMLVVPVSVKPKDQVRHFFSRVLSVGNEVAIRCGRGLPVVPGTFVVYGNSMGFDFEGFQNYKFVHELNILGVMRDRDREEISDNIMLLERMLQKRLTIEEHTRELKSR